jgi:hypothetical protein
MLNRAVHIVTTGLGRLNNYSFLVSMAHAVSCRALSANAQVRCRVNVVDNVVVEPSTSVSAVNVIPAVLHTRFHVHSTFTRRASGRNLLFPYRGSTVQRRASTRALNGHTACSARACRFDWAMQNAMGLGRIASRSLCKTG